MVNIDAGIATLTQLNASGFYEALDEKSGRLAAGLKGASEKTGINVKMTRAGSMLGLFFTDRDVNNFEDAKTSDLKMFSDYYRGMLREGVYLAPSQFEAIFVSASEVVFQVVELKCLHRPIQYCHIRETNILLKIPPGLLLISTHLLA